jgi:hypothetical protein
MAQGERRSGEKGRRLLSEWLSGRKTRTAINLARKNIERRHASAHTLSYLK